MPRAVLLFTLASCLPQVGPPVGNDSGSEPNDAGMTADAGCPGFAGCTSFVDGTTVTFPNGGSDTYSPKCLRVHVGQPVTFTGGTFSDHPLVQSCGPSTVLGASGGTSAQFTFSTEGTWGYYCSAHGSAAGLDMAGAIEVVRCSSTIAIEGMCARCGATKHAGAIVCGRCGNELVAPENDPLIGTELGNYRVLARLGVGGMGTVYSGVEKQIDKRVAIKIVHPHLAEFAELPTLLAEAKAVNAIGDRGIVDVHGFGALPDGRQYLVMELLEGVSLEDHLRANRKLPLPELVAIGDGMLTALEAAHEAGFVHRDIKPANVFLVKTRGGDPLVKLLDFGLAQRSSATSAFAVGTPAYIAPEQAQAHAQVGPAADLYSVGCVLYEMAAGTQPIPDGNVAVMLEMHKTGDRPHPRALRPELPVALDQLIVSMMAIEPRDRPASAALARQKLREVVPSKRSRARWLVAAALLVAAAASAWAVTRTADPPPPPPDPIEQSVKITALGIHNALEAGEWKSAVERLVAAEKSLPGRREWEALRAEAGSQLRVTANQALAKDDIATAETVKASLEQLVALDAKDPLLVALERLAFAAKNGMVRVSGVLIDRYEYPNRAGAAVATGVDFDDAVKLCAQAGKHLCSEDEWQRACGGREFPYGATLEPSRCHHKGKLKGAMPAGALAGCVSEQGVHDMSGNVAEWTSTPFREGKPQRVIRGGSFGQSDAQLSCTARDYYLPGLGGAKHIGLRCCL